MGKQARLDRIVLVHGAMHGAWCWEVLTPLLEQRGFEVSALDLPGAGADRTPPKDVTLQSYIDRTVAVVNAGRAPVLLVGHSMGGMPISGAGEAIPDRIGKLLYLAAILPKNGETLFDGMGPRPEESAARAVRPSDIEGASDFDRALAPKIFYNCCTPDVAARAVQRLGALPTEPLTASIALTAERWGRIPKTYIVCARDQGLPPARQHSLCDRAPEVKKLVMDTDHSPFYSDPVGLAEIIEREARL